MCKNVSQYKKQENSYVISKFICCMVLLLLCSCGFKFSTVKNTYNGITMTLEGSSSSFRGKIICDNTSEYSDICANTSNYKIVVYVQTDILYIHPYRNFYASIGQDGSWSVEKKDRRPFPVAVYAFVLRKTTPIPDLAASMDELEYLAWVKWNK